MQFVMKFFIKTFFIWLVTYFKSQLDYILPLKMTNMKFFMKFFTKNFFFIWLETNFKSQLDYLLPPEMTIQFAIEVFYQELFFHLTSDEFQKSTWLSTTGGQGING